ncbi:MAG: hypothetical protein AB7G13_32450 [Lautropia sp.]
MSVWTDLMTRIAARKRRVERVRLLRRALTAAAGQRAPAASDDEFGAPEGGFGRWIAERAPRLATSSQGPTAS